MDVPAPLRIPEPFEPFYRSDYRRVVALIHGLTGSGWVAEDIAQEAFLRAHRDWGSVGLLDSPAAWVRRVAINLATSRFRRMRTEARALVRLGREATAVTPLAAESEMFWDEVRRLPRRQAQALALRYVDDLTTAEIAEVLSVAEGTVRALLHQGRTRLERQLVAKGLVTP